MEIETGTLRSATFTPSKWMSKVSTPRVSLSYRRMSPFGVICQERRIFGDRAFRRRFKVENFRDLKFHLVANMTATFLNW